MDVGGRRLSRASPQWTDDLFRLDALLYLTFSPDHITATSEDQHIDSAA